MHIAPCSLWRSPCWSHYQVDNIGVCSPKICAVFQKHRIAEVGGCFWRSSSPTIAQRRRLPGTMSSGVFNISKDGNFTTSLDTYLLMTNALTFVRLVLRNVFLLCVSHPVPHQSAPVQAFREDNCAVNVSCRHSEKNPSLCFHIGNSLQIKKNKKHVDIHMKQDKRLQCVLDIISDFTTMT